MTVRAVVLPATPLLVPGAAGGATVLAAVRDAVLVPLRRAVAEAGSPRRWGVLADAAVDRRGARRASLAAAGIADRWVPALSVPALPADPGGTPAVAGVPASVALWAVAAAAGPLALEDVEVVELGPAPGAGTVAAAVEALDAVDVLVRAAGAPRAASAAVLDVLARRGGWAARTVEVPVDGPHLPASYAVTTFDDAR